MLRLRKLLFAGLVALLAAVVIAAVARAQPPVSRPVKITEYKPIVKAKWKPEKLYPENTRLVERKGRIVVYEMDVLGEREYKPHFRSAFVGTTDKDTFVLLENRILEKLEKIAGRGKLPVEVTGTLYEYKGINYLLLTRASVATK